MAKVQVNIARSDEPVVPLLLVRSEVLDWALSEPEGLKAIEDALNSL